MGSESLKDLFLLDPSVTFFNHGSFGACPRPIFREYQQWQTELERQPVEFLARRSAELLHRSRSALAEFIGCDADELVYVTNATTATNIIARSFHLAPGDEILTTNLEYGALDRTWQAAAARTGATYRRVPFEFPLSDRESFVDRFWSFVQPATRLIFMSHITSATGLVLPVSPIISRAREVGIPIMIDGAHVPGQLDLDLHELAPDYYTGNCHKWMMTPKGSAFLYVRRERQVGIEPLVVSWGSMSVEDSPFLREHEAQGTRDISAFLAVPAGIRFFEQYDWRAKREACRALALEIRDLFAEIFGNPPLAPTADWYAQLVAHKLPPHRVGGGQELQQELYNRHKVEIPVTEQNGDWYIRASVQAYNDQADMRILEDGLREAWPSIREPR